MTLATRFCSDGSVRFYARFGRRMLVLWLGVITLLGGCSPSLQSGPPRLYSLDEQKTAIRDQLKLPDLNTYLALDPDRRTAYRNEFLTAQMYAIDLAYNAYEASLTQERQDVGLLSTAALLGLTSAATLVSAEVAKNALTAAATGVTGLNAGYDEQVLLKQTIQTLQIEMRASRARIAAQIFTKMRLSSDQYPLTLGLSDIESYYQAGTITGALIDSSTAASANAITSEDNRNAVITYRLAADANSAFLRNLLTSGGVYHSDYDRRMRDLLAQYGVHAGLGDVVSLPQFQDVRARLVSDLAANRPVDVPRRPQPRPRPIAEPTHASHDVFLDANAIKINLYVQHDQIFDEARKDSVLALASAGGADVKLTDLISSPKLASLRAAIVEKLHL